MTKRSTDIVAAGDYNYLLTSISDLLNNTKNLVIRQVNNIIVLTYWNIGRYIIEYEQKGKDRAKYGSELLKKLSNDLKIEFGRGFSVDNLEAMRKFYIVYPQLQKSETVSRKLPKSVSVSRISSEIDEKRFKSFSELSWSHFRTLIRIDDNNKRSFYEIEIAKNNWSVRELKRQINSMLYERIAVSKDKKGVKELAKHGEIIEKPEDAIRDPYVLEFLGLKEESIYTEKRLESALIDNLQNFLIEMGRGFTFVARQKRLSINNEHYYIDLVLFKRILKCLVLIDLKLGKFDHIDVGQMNFYLNYFKKNEVLDGENMPIGLILCADKDDVFVEYALGGLSNKIFASRYRLALPTEQELKKVIRKGKYLLEGQMKKNKNS